MLWPIAAMERLPSRITGATPKRLQPETAASRPALSPIALATPEQRSKALWASGTRSTTDQKDVSASAHSTPMSLVKPGQVKTRLAIRERLVQKDWKEWSSPRSVITCRKNERSRVKCWRGTIHLFDIAQFPEGEVDPQGIAGPVLAYSPSPGRWC